MKLGSTNGLNRRSDLRSNQEWLDKEATNSTSRFMITVDLKPSVISNEDQTKSEIRWFTAAEIEKLGLMTQDFFFLGIDGQERAHFLIALSEHRARHVTDGPYSLKPLVDVRSLAMQGVLTDAELSLAGEARSLAAWHISHRCCGHCGGVARVKDGGWRRKCWACGQEQYPRMDPVVIMLVVHDDHCLLARDTRFPETLYSALAGYLEPGEDIESAVIREVFEEVGLKITAVDYKYSQPWPFPHSLMIGCQAKAASTELHLDHDEIADAFWVDRKKLADLLEGAEADSVDLPGNYAIAHKLMRDFLDE